MTTAPVKLWDIYEGLKNNFLFNSDINSIHILLSLYDLEENIQNISPKYTCTKDINRKIKNCLRYRHDRDLMAHNISLLIHEDISRLELCFYLEGYKYGYYNNKWANSLEQEVLKLVGIKGMYKRPLLFHFDTSNIGIKHIYDNVKAEIEFKERRDRYFEGLILSFCNKVIKEKIYNFNKYINKQLKLDFTPYSFNISEELHKISEGEVDKIYMNVVKIISKSLKKTFKEAAWYALNDKVANRYN